MADLHLRHEAPAHCCPYCLKPVGYIGRGLSLLFGAKIHKCDFLNVDTEAERFRQRIEAAEDDMVRIHHEKVDTREKLRAAEKDRDNLFSANRELHRRAQKAEGKLQRMEEAHRIACRHAFTKSIDYHLYAHILLNCNQSLFPKLVSDGSILPDPALDIRNKALEEAAQVAERLGSHLVRGESGPEYVGGNLDVAAAIRSLSVAKEPE
ncbi:hypothetical protein [Rhizobium lusitanum]|uniref:Uncharacterized protein n=1 Tax=Rhizobium lusitanum TaxID=293958 RepID=A0A1C3VSM2_9HYPH|nr:hypothetical protein [Rhizobium lusitanum]SCB30772.1 hypothetical protein GA0061101_106156 [Rhizobium lusitanum]